MLVNTPSALFEKIWANILLFAIEQCYCMMFDMSMDADGAIEKFDLQTPKAEKTSLNHPANLVIGATLAGVAVLSKVAEATELTKDMPDVLRATVESGAHPILGFVGGLAARALSNRFFEGSKQAYLWMGVAAATANDLGSEIAQDHLLSGVRPFYAPEHAYESTKDLAFALAGFGIAVLLSRNRAAEAKPEQAA